MPWNAKSIKKHNKKGTAKSARMANHIRDSVLKRGGSEKEADRVGLATSSKFLKSHGKHNSPAKGPHVGLSGKSFGFAGKGSSGLGHRGPRPGDHGPRASRGMHKFGTVKPSAGGLINR